jgi:transposase
MKHSLIVGVDVSKLTLDFCFKPTEIEIHIANNLQGFKHWFKVLKQHINVDTEVLVIMEHTGMYSYQYELFLSKHSIAYCKICPLQIKRSLGVVRGKNDKLDAERIASYGWMRRDMLTADHYPVKAIERLRDLLSLRRKLIQDRSGYMCRQKELKSCGRYTKSDIMSRMQDDLIRKLSTNLQVLEKEIKELLKSDEILNKTYLLLRTIKGVGLIVGAYMIACTHNFQRFANARKFNCYAGLAPFAYESGTSIKGRSRVSHLANKEAKTLLTLAASSAIQHDPELKTYYQKRITEGKEKMSCLNIIRAKIVARIFAVAKRQTPYQALTIAA